MIEAKTVHEKVASAALSKHLQHQPYNCAIDTIGALGMAGVENRLSSSVFRLKYGNEPRFYGEALMAVGIECKRLALLGKWKGGSASEYNDLNIEVLKYWLNDRCAACDGLGYEKIAGTPKLSARACDECDGSSKRPPPAQKSSNWNARFLMLLARIEQMEADAGAAVMRKLSFDMREFKEVTSPL